MVTRAVSAILNMSHRIFGTAIIARLYSSTRLVPFPDMCAGGFSTYSPRTIQRITSGVHAAGRRARRPLQNHRDLGHRLRIRHASLALVWLH